MKSQSNCRKDPLDHGYQVGPGIWVVLRYAVFDVEGEPVTDEDAELTAVFGYASLLPALEAALLGRFKGDRVSLRLTREEAYGPRDPSLVFEAERTEFPDDVAAGDRFEAETFGGQSVVLTVLDVTAQGVIVDPNPPLAGQELRVEVEVKDLRPATAEELRNSEKRVREQELYPGLIPAGRLLRGGSQG